MVITFRKSLLFRIRTTCSHPLRCSYCLGIPDRVADAESESESGLQRRKQGGKKESSSEMKKSPWFRYNDEVITKVSLEEVLGSEAYILM